MTTSTIMSGALWSQAEIDYIRSTYPTSMPTKAIAAKLRRSVGAVEKVARSFGLRRPPIDPCKNLSVWRNAETARIKRRRHHVARFVAVGMERCDICEALAISGDVLSADMRALGLARRAASKPTPPRAKRIVAELYPTTASMAHVIEASGLRKNQIIGLAHRMGLRRPERARTWA